jgi:hypothetical protein
MEYLERSSAADDRQKLDYEEIFGNNSGEDENPKILAGYFVEHQSFSKAYDKTRPLEIVKARKGMGKSALLSHLKYRLTDIHSPIDPRAVVIKVTGNELMGLADFSGTDPSLLENRWRQVICKRISMELAKEIGFAGSDDSMSLIEAAEIEGFKGRNLVSGLMARLGSVVESTTKALSGSPVGLKSTNPTDSRTLGYEQILRRMQESGDRNVWLLVDDIDAKFVDTEALQTRIGAFFSALRSLAFSVEGLRARASVRTDVWTNLRSMEDQDKLRQYITEIKWSEEQLKNIFAKRILSYLQRNGEKKYADWNEQDDYHRIVCEVFSGDFRMGSEKKGDPPWLHWFLLGNVRVGWDSCANKLAAQQALY